VRTSIFHDLKILPHLLRPARGAAAGVVIVFALLLTVAARAGLLGIPLAFILTSWFFKYAYILFDHTVWGIDEPPPLDIQMLNPLSEQRPLAQLAILGLIYGALKLAGTTLGPAVAISLAALAALSLPASVAILGLERNILKAIYPLALAHMVRGLGAMYFVVLAVIALYIAGIGLLVRWVSFVPLELALAMFGILSMFSVLGGALYERRDELNLDTRKSPERTLEVERRAQSRQSDAVVADAYGLVRVGSHAKAWAVLQDWLSTRGNAIEDYHWLCERVSTWGDPRYATRLTEEYVERLLSLRKDGQALDVVSRRLELNPSFRPKTAAATLRIARLAARGGGAPRIARALLADFGARFPGDPSTAAAQALASELAR
jgi:hypothetical protein